MNQIDLKNKNAIITGGAQGFGLAIAKRFALSGANLIIIDKDNLELEKAIKSEEVVKNILDSYHFVFDWWKWIPVLYRPRSNKSRSVDKTYFK